MDIGWEFKNNRLQSSFNFSDFKAAFAFVKKIGKLAEEVNHHPKLVLSWGKVEVEMWTHEKDGLTEKDFELATLIDNLGK